MSLDIDWTLLKSPQCTLTNRLIDVLNTHLSTSSRPSFIGPIQVTAFDFGSSGPDMEIKDIRDVWRAFDEADEEGDHEEFSLRQPAPPVSSLDDEMYDMVSANEAKGYFNEEDAFGLDDTSIYSGLASPRQSVGAVGMGFGSSALHFGMGRDYASAIMSSLPAQQNPSLFSQPHLRPRRGQPFPSAPSLPRPALRSAATSPPASRPSSLPSPNSLPSVQLHLKFRHQSDLSLTLLTSLSINYPAPSFMSLPLRLTVTGITLNADIILAYSGDKHRIYMSLVDEDDGDHLLSMGERLLPSLAIESEIGHTDAHVLRNVGKVEKFIADVIRKTLVEELAFPNFQTVAL